ncbi:MAG TPA: 7TM diverse intracellular signaling domain-containing protein [Bacteroidia bacterium]|nr:7TM diverse intracellular signaling domain-containing protein [Bacteroidia bacterium]
MRKLLCFLFILLALKNLAQTDTADAQKPFLLLEQAFEHKDWAAVARLQKICYALDKNQGHLLWSARCYAWLRDTANTLNTLDTALLCGFTNIYILDGDTAFDFIRSGQRWQEIRQGTAEKYKQKEVVFYWGFYYGILSLILLFNFFLFISNKDLSYLFLCFILMADMHFELFNNSSLKIYITKLFPWIASAIVQHFPPPPVYVGVFLISFMLFSNSFLKLKKSLPLFNRIQYVLILLVCLFECDIFFGFKFIPEIFIQSVVALTFLLSLVAGLILWKRKLREASYFVVAVMLICAGLFANNSFNIFIFSSLNMGILLFFIILTLGVGSKVKRMQKEKEEAQEKALEVLEEKVQERTLELKQQKHLVEEKQKEIVDSISYAKRLQEAILPPHDFVKAHVKHNFIFYQPKDIVAGDFYWAEKNQDLFFIAAADSTGHGVPGAMVSIVCSNALNRAVKEFQLKVTGKILDKTRELVIETFEKSASEVKDGMDISLLCIDAKQKQVFWSGANNPLWYIQDHELKEIKADKQPIGKTDHPKPFSTHEIAYKANSTFYLFTDGLADQFGGPQGKKFKYKQFSELLLKHQDLSPAEQAERINKAFAAWKGELEQVDDICVIGIRL